MPAAQRRRHFFLMALIDALLAGFTLGGMYVLLALGLNLQYGVARIMNLSYGELLIAAAFLALVLFNQFGVAPWITLALVVPLAFVVGLGIYRLLLTPLVKRSRSREALEVDSILATFGLLFLIQGLMLVAFGGNYYSYSFLATPIHVLGTTVAANRLLALAIALVAGCGLYLLLTRTRIGTAIRAVAVDPQSAQLVGIDVRMLAAVAFALGAALVGVAGVSISMFLTFNATFGVLFTMKALIVVIMGGVGNLLGCVIAGLLLGLAESFVSTFLDPGLTLAASFGLFLTILLVRPQGLFGRAGR
jgi:branched-chain amino acid transport system permease protein